MVIKHESGNAHVIGQELVLITFPQMLQGKQITATAWFHVWVEAGSLFIQGMEHCMEYRDHQMVPNLYFYK